MEIRISHHQSIPVLTLEGRFDGMAATAFDSRIAELTHQSDAIILDFSRVAYLSSAGIRSLLKLKQHLGTRSGNIILVGVTSFVQFHYSGDDPSVSKAHGVICLMRDYSRRAVHSETDIIPYWLAALEWTYSAFSYVGFPAIRKKYALYSAAIIVNRILELEK